MSRVPILIMTLALLTCLTRPVWGDTALYQYEGDVLPYDESAGWSIFNPCEPPCSESIESGHFVLTWAEADDLVNYDLTIADPPIEPPTSLWVEWRFRSNHPLGKIFTSCDAAFVVHFREVIEPLNIYGDAAISFRGGDSITNLNIQEFHLYRFESVDGINFTIGVDGTVFYSGTGDRGNGYNNLQMHGRGGCNSDQFPNMINEWDFVRYGEIGFGERVVSTDPPRGWVDAQEHGVVDRIAVTFDAPNYVYMDDISVEVTLGPDVTGTFETPVVTKTWRREGDGPETLEIVLDRPLPAHAHTRFIFDDGGCDDGDPETECHQPVIDFSFIPGDASANGRIDLADFAVLQNCFGESSAAGICRAVELAGSNVIDLLDHDMLLSWWGRP